MNVLIVGATGQLGKLVTQTALNANHSVIAFSRRPEKLQLTHPKLRLHAGDVQAETDIDAAVTECDAVIVTIGAGMSRSGTVRSAGTQNVINAMREHGVKRLICQSTLGAQESWSNLNFYWKVIMFGAIIKPVFKDHERHEQTVQDSELDWTIVRPSAFTDKPGRGDYLVDIQPGQRHLTLKISKQEIANFLVAQLADLSLIHI